MGSLKTLKEQVAEIQDIRHAIAVLGWDLQTYMPPGGAEARAEQTATLNRIAHEKLVAEEMGETLSELEQQMAQGSPNDDDYALFRQAKREYERNLKLPADLVARLARTTSLAHQVWVEARRKSDFSLFAPVLQEIVNLELEMAQAIGFQDSVYDPLLDNYEPEMRVAEVKDIFDRVKAELVPLVKAIRESGLRVKRDFLEQEFDLDEQWRMSIELLRAIGYDFNRGRQDKVPHPFTTTFSVNDVRVTNRFYSNQLWTGIFGALHEGGHALYNQGYDPDYDRSFLAGGASLGVHESQSRMWENLVGRSLTFWRYWLPLFQQAFPAQLRGVSVEDFYRAVNVVRPSAIRVEADEVTYNLHVFLRFEIEQGLLERTIRVEELPEIWNRKMEEYLGYRPKNDAEGVLQDVHWSYGYFGYFPTYSLGNILSVQFFALALKEMPDLLDQFARGEFQNLLAWGRENIHRHGAKYFPKELVHKITGGPINPEPYISYLKQKYGDIYRLQGAA